MSVLVDVAGTTQQLELASEELHRFCEDGQINVQPILEEGLTPSGAIYAGDGERGRPSQLQGGLAPLALQAGLRPELECLVAYVPVSNIRRPG
mmetsp:Transcript_18885/g.37112  ORF Transcript_18885/g.37112 Transcript_18885/m.37112 type:complete len:93 (-) Transcript_18885:610-888(-)